jgi:hypothetical protein
MLMVSMGSSVGIQPKIINSKLHVKNCCIVIKITSLKIWVDIVIQFLLINVAY